MESLLNFESVTLSQCYLNSDEECGFSGDYTLPEYCPDIATVLKCWAVPRLQNRQFSGDKLLLDGAVNLRVVYLDEGRNRLHSVEFGVPYSCSMRGCGVGDTTPVFWNFETKYVNCRATNPRRLEVHGAVQVCAQMYGNGQAQIAMPVKDENLYARFETAKTSIMVGATEKVITLNEVLEFPQSLPPAEMLLGGFCSARVKDWKVLNGKVIARGSVWVHQLYTDDQEVGTTQALDFELPFSQILDVIGAKEGHLCCGEVQILSDTERCSVGPDGSNTLLEVTAKLMLQIHVYEPGEIAMLQEAYHTKCPVKQETEDNEYQAFCGSRMEQTTLPLLHELPDSNLQEIIDVCVQPQSTVAVVEGEAATISGVMLLSILGKNLDGEIEYIEEGHEYRLEFPCVGNSVKVTVQVENLLYRVVDGKLELQMSLSICLCQYQITKIQAVCSLELNPEETYSKSKMNAMLYYAQPGETLWEIARDCHTSPDVLGRENEQIGETIIDSCVLLVPIV